MKKHEDYVKTIKKDNVYLAKINFEDGYDKKLGTNHKIRPILIIDKFYNKENNETSYIVAPIYSVKDNEKKYDYNCYIDNWKNSFNKNNDFYKAKFKVSQIQIINKKSIVKKNVKGVYKYRQIECNSPMDYNDICKLNIKIHKYYNTLDSKERESNTKDVLKIYIRREIIKKDKISQFYPEYYI